MPTFLLVSLYEFKQFLQIVLWIAVPGTIIAVILTTILHYRRKKALQREPEPELANGSLYMAGDMGQLPDWLASADPENTSLLKKYEREVRRYKENYATLEQDYRNLENKYSDLLNKAYHNDQPANDNMEVHDLRIRLTQLEEENIRQKEKLEESQYIRDLLDEKKAQTEFLQQQLELRIKNYHQLEKQTSHASAELSQLKTAADEFDSKEQAMLVDLEQKQEAIRHQVEHIQKLESGLDELHQQQSALQSVIDEKQNAIDQLEVSIGSEQQKTRDLEQKLELSNQLFARIYAELSNSFDAGMVNGQNGKANGIHGPITTAN